MLARREHNLLTDIDRTMARCSGARVARSETGITVCASGPDGFDMAVVVEDGRFIVALDEWVEEFENGAHAVQLFIEALQGTARLRVDTLAGRRWRWTVERCDESGAWIPESTVAHVIWRFWGRRSVVYLRNTFELGGAEPG